MNQAEAFLLDQVPMVTRSLIPTTLKTAYSAAVAHVQETPFLNVPSAKDNCGRIIAWAVDFGFQKLIESGQWSADYRWQPFASPTGRYLEIILSHSVVTISQVCNSSKQPRDVKFRKNKRLNNQGCLDIAGFCSENKIIGLPHILLLHGHRTLNFAHLGVPNESHTEGFIYKTANLMLMPHEVPITHEAPVEDTDYDSVMTLKEEIDRWRKDNGA